MLFHFRFEWVFFISLQWLCCLMGSKSFTVHSHLITISIRHCGPRLSAAARDKLRNHFVQIRAETRRQEMERSERSAIPITVRQLEALVRLSESLAKMALQPFVGEHHVDEAIRLFKVDPLPPPRLLFCCLFILLPYIFALFVLIRVHGVRCFLPFFLILCNRIHHISHFLIFSSPALFDSVSF